MKKHVLLAVVVSAVGTTDYKEAYTVTDLTTNLSAGNNVKLMNDLTFTFSSLVNQSTISEGKDVTLNLN